MKYGKLTIIEKNIELTNKYNKRRTYVNVICDCGTKLTVRKDCLVSGNTKSCGCLNKEHHFKIHNKSKTRLYHVWEGIKTRCNKSTDKSYKHYGARGIRVCDEWNTPIAYPVFETWALKNGYLPGLTIERINVDGNYEPSNCKWIPPAQQSNNTRKNVLITYNNKTQNINQWARELNINKNTFWRYIRVKHYSIETILKIYDKKCND